MMPLYPDSPSACGHMQERVRGEQYDTLVDETVTALRARYGASLLVHWEDFAASNAFRLLAKYQSQVLGVLPRSAAMLLCPSSGPKTCQCAVMIMRQGSRLSALHGQ